MKKIIHKDTGFSLLELIVVIAMLAVLFSVLIGILNPLAQINKARDASLQEDLSQIKTSLDTYNNDHGCYPVSLQFGQQWQQGSALYMKLVPEDSDCTSNPNRCYLYQTDGSACPSWNVLYGVLRNKSAASSNKTLCALSSLSSCLPTNYTSQGYDYCVVSGNVDCSYISSNPLPPAILPTPTGIPTPTPTEGPTCLKNYSCTGGPPARCNRESGTNNGTYCTSNCDGACM